MKRALQILFNITFLAFSWLIMQVVHECGHVLGGWISGGTVERVVLHPLVISRTDMAENPHPLFEVWCGPVFGVLAPLLFYVLAARFKMPGAYIAGAFTGFCLIANGVYLGIGWLEESEDAYELIAYGAQVWQLVLFGLITAPPGLYLWHRISPQFGFGDSQGQVSTRAVVVLLVLLVLVVSIELMANFLLWGAANRTDPDP